MVEELLFSEGGGPEVGGVGPPGPLGELEVVGGGG